MAVVGDALQKPESGWIRIKACNSKFLYDDDWMILDSSYGVYYDGTVNRQGATKLNATMSFAFFGDKLRIISTYSKNHSGHIDIDIDGNVESFALNLTTTAGGILAYEKKLENGIHHVTITNKDADMYCILDCFDINEGGEFIQYQEYLLAKKTRLEDMEIGDIIPCRFTALKSGSVGAFSELGSCEMDLIPRYSADTVDGRFYFVKVDKNKFIADRNLQRNISWNELNNKDIVDGIPCWYNKTSIKFEKKDSFIWFSNSKVKSAIKDRLTARIKVYKEDWTKGNMVYSEGERLFSSTNRGGMSLVYLSSSKSIRFVAYIGGSYVGPTASIQDIKTGWLDICVIYDGFTIELYINGELRDSYSVTGAIGHGDTNWFCVGAEPDYNSGIEPGSYPSLSDAKISHFSLYSKVLSLSELQDDVKGDEDDLVIWADPKNSSSDIIVDKSKNKNHGTIVGCTFEYEKEHDIITLPTGGVAYNGADTDINSEEPIYDKPCTSHQNRGGWPTCNDWDTYICGGNSDQKIAPNNNDIWNHQKIATICRERVIPDMKDITDQSPALPSNNVFIPTRGLVDGKIDDTTAKRMNIASSNLYTSDFGFRPMLILGGTLNG